MYGINNTHTGLSVIHKKIGGTQRLQTVIMLVIIRNLLVGRELRVALFFIPMYVIYLGIVFSNEFRYYLHMLLH